MKLKILKAMPSVFSLRNNGGYEKIVVYSGAERMMRASWSRVGHELEHAIAKVGRDVEKQKNCK